MILSKPYRKAELARRLRGLVNAVAALIATSRQAQLAFASSEGEPGDPAPVDAVAIEVRQVDRERLPIGIMPIVVVTVRVVPAWGGLGIRLR
jgi:hypothetical protein